MGIRRGISLNEFISLYDFECLNYGQSTFFKSLNGGKGSVLDLTFANFKTDFKWSVSPISFNGSHHHPINVEIHIFPEKFLAKSKLLKNLSQVTLDDNLFSAEIKTATYKVKTNRTQSSGGTMSYKQLLECTLPLENEQDNFFQFIILSWLLLQEKNRLTK